jgi:hypothetical protein
VSRVELSINYDGRETVLVYEDDDEASPTAIALVETFKEAARTKDFGPFHKLLEEVVREKWQNVSTDL